MKLKAIVICFFLSLQLQAQDFITRNGNISFYSHTPLEDIKADNNEVVSVLNSATGALDFKIAIKSFHFPKQAMENHFNNDKYMNSEQYPKAGFSGKITNLQEVDFTKDGTYAVHVEGSLTIKNVTKPLTTKGTISIAGAKVSAKASFSVNRREFNIIGEAFVQNRLSDQIQVTVDCMYDKR